MSTSVSVLIWLFVSGYALFIRQRASRNRERSGRSLVGVGAALVAIVLLIPTTEMGFSAGDVLSLAGALLAGVLLAGGIIVSFPEEWRRGQRAVHDDALPLAAADNESEG